MKKAALYVRVSTGKQDVENQLLSLREYASKRGFQVVRTFTDVASGARADRRMGFNKMMSAAAAKEFDTILVWALDRLSREGMSKTVNLIEHLNNIGINVVSYTEPYLDTTNELARNILLAVVATLAKAEREKISERTKAGLVRARKHGARIGRPGVPAQKVKEILALHKRRWSLRAIAGEVGISHTAVAKIIKNACK